MVHSLGVFANDAEETEIVFVVFDRAVFERFDKGENRSQRRAKLVRDVGEKFLADFFEIVRFASCRKKFRSRISLVFNLDRRDVNVKCAPLAGQNFEIYFRRFLFFQRLAKRFVNGKVADNFAQTFVFERAVSAGKAS